MRFVIAGKKDTYFKYLKEYAYTRIVDDVGYHEGCGCSAKYLKNKISMSSFVLGDTIVLLHGWFAKNWAKQFIQEVWEVHPRLVFEYKDGEMGEAERKKLQSENICSRFDLLDL